MISNRQNDMGMIKKLLAVTAMLMFSPALAIAQEVQPDLAQPVSAGPETQVMLDTLWVLLASVLVFFMHTGFAMLESGLTRSKNTVNILAKNVIALSISSVIFWAVGFGLMFGDGNTVIGWGGFFLSGADNSPATGESYQGIFHSLSWTGVPLYTKLLFETFFAAAAAAIVSGAIAERMKFYSYFLFSVLLVGFLYPVSGHWVWGGGWLAGMGFMDFAGSAVIHTVGGVASIVGAAMLGPRLGRYKGGRVIAMPGHNIPLAAIGMFILWVGWFGFNAGSVMAVNPELISKIAVNSNIAASAGVLAAVLVASAVIGKPDLSMVMNGALAGLVAITAGCDGASPIGSAIVGIIAGTLVVYSVLFFDKLQIDDPVGAISVHFTNGVWGTIAVGLFNTEKGLLYGGGAGQLGIQLLGVVSIAVYAFAGSFVVWSIVKLAMGLRVNEEEEYKGLDIGEHGMEAYPDFATNSRLF